MNDMFIGHSAGWYDPPDEATHWECDKCGQVWDSFYLNKDKRGYEWICDECLEEMGEESDDEN